MASTLDWKSSEDPRDIVHIAVQALVEGRLVALPVETAYHVFASGLRPGAVHKLVDLTRRKKVRSPCVYLRSPQEALDYSPDMSVVASRIADRGWPGPLVLQLPAGAESSLTNYLPADVREPLLIDGQYLPQRVAAHDAVVQAMRLMPGPLIAASMVQANGDAICSGKQAAELADESVAAVVDDGSTHYGGFAPIVRVDGNECQVIAPGVVDSEALQRLSQLIILFVCTGNTCRSPMAEAICRAEMAQRFPHTYDPANVVISSAGLSAFPGGPASPEAVQVLKKKGLDLLHHQSRSVTERTLRQADLVLTMSNSHRTAILERMPMLAEKVHLLSGTAADVADPFGGSESVYADCADQIEKYIQSWLGRIDESWFPIWRQGVS